MLLPRQGGQGQAIVAHGAGPRLQAPRTAQGAAVVRQRGHAVAGSHRATHRPIPTTRNPTTLHRLGVHVPGPGDGVNASQPRKAGVVCGQQRARAARKQCLGHRPCQGTAVSRRRRPPRFVQQHQAVGGGGRQDGGRLPHFQGKCAHTGLQCVAGARARADAVDHTQHGMGRRHKGAHLEREGVVRNEFVGEGCFEAPAQGSRGCKVASQSRSACNRPAHPPHPPTPTAPPGPGRRKSLRCVGRSTCRCCGIGRRVVGTEGVWRTEAGGATTKTKTTPTPPHPSLSLCLACSAQ